MFQKSFGPLNNFQGANDSLFNQMKFIFDRPLLGIVCFALEYELASKEENTSQLVREYGFSPIALRLVSIYRQWRRKLNAIAPNKLSLRGP